MTDFKTIEEAKAYADSVNLTYSPNIGLATLNEKIKAHIEKEDSSLKEYSKAELALINKVQQREAALTKVHVSIVCNNPDKIKMTGEIITASNSIVGTVREYVPFDKPEGWMVSRIVLNVLKDRTFIRHEVYRDPVTGNEETKAVSVKEFNITELPDLTKEQLDELKKEQLSRKQG